ncbi:hypothetical protein GF420_09530 [candidate division GN15 bacterium]|nr:hypothetical protein [candidate division GN15 bacterium]
MHRLRSRPARRGREGLRVRSRSPRYDRTGNHPRTGQDLPDRQRLPDLGRCSRQDDDQPGPDLQPARWYPETGAAGRYHDNRPGPGLDGRCEEVPLDVSQLAVRRLGTHRSGLPDDPQRSDRLRTGSVGGGVRIRLVQKAVDDLDILPHIERAEADNRELVCFSELATSGCLYERQDVPPLEAMQAGLTPYSIRVITGLPYLSEEGLRNACLYYHQGFSLIYHKVNLFEPFNEPKVYVPGIDTGIWQTDFETIGVAICFDLRFPALFDEMRQADAKWIVVPAAFPMVRVDDWRALLIERAKQTGATVLGINAVGRDKQNEFGGNSMAVAPDGQVLAEAGRTEPELLDIDL